MASVDAWAAKQDDRLGRSETIRRLVELGLTVKPISVPTDRLRSARALELAAEVIDGLTSGGRRCRPEGQPKAATPQRAGGVSERDARRSGEGQIGVPGNRFLSLSRANKRSICGGTPLQKEAGLEQQQHIQQQGHPRRSDERQGNFRP
jgi:hypothetical protein